MNKIVDSKQGNNALSLSYATVIERYLL